MKFSPALRRYYAEMYASMEPEKIMGAWTSAQAVAEVLASSTHRHRYKSIADHADVKPVPWYVVAILHHRENSYDCDRGYFHANIANGEPWNQETTIVPKGRGPYESFYHASVDTIALEKKKNAELRSLKFDCIEDHCFFFEQWNGFGFLLFRQQNPSTYLWGRTNHQKRGGYPKDGKWDPDYENRSLGAILLLRALMARGRVPVINLAPSKSASTVIQPFGVDSGGFEVSRMQTWLNGNERAPSQHNLKTDGDPGPKTQRRFQQVMGFPMTGAPDRTHEFHLL